MDGLTLEEIKISIHAPHAGSDAEETDRGMVKAKFQSTLPMRGATPRCIQGIRSLIISIHAPHAGSDYKTDTRVMLVSISIHAPHAGSDFARS